MKKIYQQSVENTTTSTSDARKWLDESTTTPLKWGIFSIIFVLNLYTKGGETCVYN